MKKEISAIKRLTNNFLKQHQIYTKNQVKEQARIGNVLKNFSNEENKIPATITISRDKLKLDKDSSESLVDDSE